MPHLLGAVLRSALPAALMLGAVGFGYSQLAATVFPDSAEATRRVPLAMAGWGLVLGAAYGLLGGLWRAPKPEAAPPVETPKSGLDPEVERLLQRIEAESQAHDS